MSEFLSNHFTYEEAIHSNIGDRLKINNIPPALIKATMQFTASYMENVRNILNNDKIIVSSWYRSPELNRLVGGVSSSQHIEGLAVDFICPEFGSPFECCQEILKRKNLLNYDQLIYEYTWVHISFVRENPRGQELTKNAKDYIIGIKEIV